MLSSNLLRVKRKGNRILPSFASISYENEYAASLLIGLYEEHVGKTKGELESSLEEVESQLEDMGYHPKFVKGLLELLDRLVVCEKPKTSIPPEVARRTVFTVSSEKGFAVSGEARSSIMEEAAKRLNLSLEELVKAFDASYEGSEIIISFKSLEPADLIKYYNLSLLQTLIFKAISMSLVASMTGGEMKRVVAAVKRLGLMYTATKANGEVKLDIDGPASLFLLTRRYGTRMAKVVPLITRLKVWRLKADIYYMDKRLFVELDDRCKDLLPIQPPIEESFDSFIEEDFMLRFKALNLGWDIVREPEPLIIDGLIFIPDFAILKGNSKVYLEIVGFWTPEYLEKKLRKLRNLREPIIVAVSKNLACANDVKGLLSTMPKAKLIVFADKLRSSDVVVALRELEGTAVLANPIEKFEVKGLEPKRQVDEDAVANYLSGIREEPLVKVLERLKAFGLEDPREIFNTLKMRGLTVIWRGLDQSEAVVKRV
ncbi:MAG: DUF790 family protein [Candidatus Nezhaarchaeota archaeon]|nr:DUF790 family protein [Candidatus Nezhaarchaeota archaeon]